MDLKACWLNLKGYIVRALLYKHNIIKVSTGIEQENLYRGTISHGLLDLFFNDKKPAAQASSIPMGSIYGSIE